MNINEIAIKIMTKLHNTNLNAAQLTSINSAVMDILEQYDIRPKSIALTSTDLEVRIFEYLLVKKCEGLNEKTLYNYGLFLRKIPQTIPKMLKDITTNDLRLFIASQTNGKKETTRATMTDMLKSFFNWLHSEGILPFNPCDRIPRVTIQNRCRKPLSYTELELVRNGCLNLRDRALVEMLYSTGMRISECLSVNLSDIKQNSNELRVTGKGNKTRTVIFSDKARVHLNAYINSRPEGIEPLFASLRKPYKRLAPAGAQVVFQKIKSVNNFNFDITPHIFRHTMATHCLSSGMPLTVIQTLLGHTNPATTQIYAETTMASILSQYNMCFTG